MPAGSTYEPIATTTLGSNTNSYTFTSIPGTYTDLILICADLGAQSAQTIYVQANSDTGSNYSHTWLNGNGSVAQSGRASNNSQGFAVGGSVAGLPSSIGAMGIMHIQGYSNTTTFKTAISRYNFGGASGETQAAASLWRSTSAINALKVYASGATNILAGAVFTLYGISAA
jgi:hypothetical protein